MTSEIKYLGELRTQATHLKSGEVIYTDAPTDNHGKGAMFSPTDLVATALGNCMITVMGIKARDLGVDLTGTKIEITKIMESNPRRISEIVVAFNIPIHPSEKDRIILERTAITCPVAQSLHPNLKQTVSFVWQQH